MPPKPQPGSSQDSSDRSAERKPLPFEPAKNRKLADKKLEKKAASSAPVASAKAEKSEKRVNRASRAAPSGIPEGVSRRMIKRMALFSGIPTALGMSTFVVSYLVVTNDLILLPNYVVLLVSLGWFGLGVLGLSYGVLSASWDEDDPGSKLGWAEFKTNWGRMLQARRSPK
jgi:VIT1/CCC1 family predicted Fe2+/Mn2+ transporter